MVPDEGHRELKHALELNRALVGNDDVLGFVVQLIPGVVPCGMTTPRKQSKNEENRSVQGEGDWGDVKKPDTRHTQINALNLLTAADCRGMSKAPSFNFDAVPNSLTSSS